MTGKESWRTRRSRPSSTPGASCCRSTSRARSGRTWQEAAQIAGQQEVRHVPARHVRRPAVQGEAHDDLDFFTFPEIDSNVGADTLDAPIDGFMLSKKPKNEDGAKALLKYLATGRGAEHLPADRPEQHRDRQGRRHQRLHRAAEEGRRADRRRHEHHAVHGPRHPPGLRLHGDDPVDPGLHQEPERRRRPDRRRSRTRRRRSSLS